MKLSSRLNWRSEANAITRAVNERRASGMEIIDLTETNPTQVHLPYPWEEISEALAKGARAPYRPDPRGLKSAREALAAVTRCPADRIVLTASTSEAYSFLLRLLLDPGDHLLTLTPGYPLFEHLAELDGVARDSAALEFQRRWHLDRLAMERQLTERTRMIALVSPNNPSGSYLTRSEQDAAAECSTRSNAALVCDEVFADYPVDPPPDRAAPVWQREDVLSFSLGGLSKSAALPHLKLSWICVGGPQREVQAAIEALELISDTFLSVATPVQEALPDLLRIAPVVRSAVMRRIEANAQELKRAFNGTEAAQLLPIEGGWSAVLRVPRVSSDEATVLELLETEGLLLHPGYFFDFDREGYLVVSLLPPESLFRAGIARLLPFLLNRLR